MAIYKTSNPEKVMQLAKSAQNSGSNGGITITTSTLGRTVTVMPWLAYGDILYDGKSGYSADISWHGWPNNHHTELPANQEFTFYTYGGYDREDATVFDDRTAVSEV